MSACVHCERDIYRDGDGEWLHVWSDQQACTFTVATPARPTPPTTGPAPMADTWHSGRSWHDHPLEDACPCPKQPCGLVVLSEAVSDCEQHPFSRMKTMRQSHPASACPALTPAPWLAPPIEDDTERVERVMAEAMRDLTWRGKQVTEAHAKALARFAARALSPDLDRARAEGREQGLREAEQAVRAQTLAEWLPHFDRWRKRAEDRLAQHDPDDGPANLCMTCFAQEPCWRRDEALEDLATLARLSSGTPTDEETRP